MKKIFFLIIMAILTACGHNTSENTTTKEVLVSKPESVTFCYSQAEIDGGFSKFFTGDHCTNDGGGSAGLVVFLDEKGEKIEDFGEVRQNTFAHIFGLLQCKNGVSLEKDEKGKTRHLVGRCSEKSCVFDANIENPWVVLSPFYAENEILHFPKSGKIPEIVAGGQDCTDGL